MLLGRSLDDELRRIGALAAALPLSYASGCQVLFVTVSKPGATKSKGDAGFGLAQHPRSATQGTGVLAHIIDSISHARRAVDLIS